MTFSRRNRDFLRLLVFCVIGISGKCGAGTHADDRNDGRDGAGHAIIDRFLVVSVLPASIRGILRRGASGFYTTLGTVLVNPERFGWNFPGFS